MNNKLLIGIVVAFYIVGFIVIFSRGPVYVTNVKNQTELQPTPQGMMTHLSQTPSTKTYLKLAAVNKDFYSEMQAEGPYTLFVPTDEAFAKLPAGQLEKYEHLDRADSWDRTNLLAAHMVIGIYPIGELQDGMVLTTVQGKKIHITKKGNTWYINDTIRILPTDIKSQNGVIHQIDSVIIPSLQQK